MIGLTLPDAPVVRWSPGRKAAVVESWLASGPGGRVRLLEQYGLTTAEVESWERRYLKHGAKGLRVDRLAQYR